MCFWVTKCIYKENFYRVASEMAFLHLVGLCDNPYEMSRSMILELNDFSICWYVCFLVSDKVLTWCNCSACANRHIRQWPKVTSPGSCSLLAAPEGLTSGLEGAPGSPQGRSGAGDLRRRLQAPSATRPQRVLFQWALLTLSPRMCIVSFFSNSVF